MSSIKNATAYRLVSLLALLAYLGCDGATSPVAPDGTTLRIEANPRTISATGQSNITVLALDDSGVPAREGTLVQLTTNLGALDSDRLRTDRDGVARTLLRGDGRTGTATVQASSGRAATVNVTVVVGTATPQPLQASFTTAIGESLTVFFTDTSTGNPTSWQWQFGDGSGSAERDPVHTYPARGSYVVTLRVGHPDGQDSVSQRITVPAAEAAAPVADFEVALEGLQATFTDKSTGTVASWEWSFGDGATSTVRHPVHVYARPGVYSVTLTVRNAAGASTASRSVAVPESELPDADFEFREVAGRRMLFRDTSTNEPTSWAWDFGDGKTSRERNPENVYATVGTYTVTLTAGNLAGSSTETKFVTVRGPLTAAFEFEVSGLTVAFSDTSTGQPTSFAWTFGDGTTSTARNPVHSYSQAGTYSVTLTVARTISGETTAQEQDSMMRNVTVP